MGLALSPNEERYVLNEVMSGQRYFSPSVFFIRGPVQPQRLRYALNRASDRHESRRAGFAQDASGTYYKYIEPEADVTLGELTMPGATDEEIIQAVREYAYQPLGLTPAGLTRFLLIRRGPDDYALGSGLHHATTDGVSAKGYIHEVFAFYDGEPNLPPAAQYRDFWSWDWRNSDEYLRGKAYWAKALAGVEEVTRFPEDRAQPDAQPFEGATVRFSAESYLRLKAAAATAKVTPFVLLYATFTVMLSRMLGQAQVATTFQSAGRRQLDPQATAHGVFSNGLVIAPPVNERQSPAQLCARLDSDIRQAIQHELFPYHHVTRLTGVHPRFGINQFPETPMPTARGLEVIKQSLVTSQSDYDLNLRLVKVGNVLDLIVIYRPAVVSAVRAQAFAEQMAALAEAFCDDMERPLGESPSTALAPPGRLPDLAEPLPESQPVFVQTAFLAAARARPDAVAVQTPDARFTYSDVEHRSRAVADALRQAEIGPGDRVAIVADRGPALVWSMLGALRVGAAFVVLDSAYPRSRLETFAQMVRPDVFVAAGGAETSVIAARLATETGRPLAAVNPAKTAPADADWLDRGDPVEPAYFLFTSGSTGAPRCVATGHAPLTNFVAWQAATFDLSSDDRFTLLSGLSHDPVLRDVFTPLSLGAALLIPEARTLREPGELSAWFRSVKPTVAHLTPALGEILCGGKVRPGAFARLRAAFWGGDRLSPATVTRLARLAPKARQVNFYGSTETPQAVGWFDYDGDEGWRHLPVGRGAAGAQLVVVGTEGRAQGVGELGEIAVRSNNLSLGYVIDGRIEPPTDRMEDGLGRRCVYRTGDLGFHMPDGTVMLVGRRDDQVKVRGFRVHLSEVAAALRMCPGVTGAEVLFVDGRIRAFVKGRRRPPEVRAVSAAIAERLPDFMRPTTIHALAAFPLLPNGKIDRDALRALVNNESAAAPTTSSDAERALIEAWGPLFRGITIGPESTYSALGGDSLSYVQAYLAAEEVLGTVPSGWQFTPISRLAAARVARRSFLGSVDLPILLRAVAITLIVGGHFSLFRYGGGGTSALMIVSGFMLGAAPLREAFARESALPVLRSFRNLFIPTLLITYAIGAIRYWRGHFEPYVFTFTADFVDFRPLWTTGTAWEIYLWYVHATLHMLLMFAALLFGLKAIGGFRFGLRNVLLALFPIACLGRFVLPGLLEPTFFTEGAPNMSEVMYLPTTHIATLILGALITTTATAREKWALVVVLAIYAALSGWVFSAAQGVALFLCGVGLMTVSRVHLPRVMMPVVLAISGASLFIYLTHQMFRSALDNLGAAESPLLAFATAIAGGIAAWAGWTMVLKFLAKRLRPVADVAPATL
jgi:amino acid adenylation domain-containing protein